MTKCPMPWVNMIINVDGEVTPCCYWTTYGNNGKGVGNVNDGGILAAWNSPEYVAIRDRLIHDVTGTPCEHCMAFQTGGSPEAFHQCYYGELNGNDSASDAIVNLRHSLDEYNADATRLTCTPPSVTIVTTAACNIDCTFCNQTPQRVDKMWLADPIVDEMISLTKGMTHLAWQGGEALLDKRFSKFLQTTSDTDKSQLVLHLVTNGLLATPDFIDTCVASFKQTVISFSIDSFEKETYERLRRGASYDKVMANFDYVVAAAKQHANLSVMVQACVMKSNLGELRALLESAERRGATLALSPVLAWPPSEAVNTFSDFAAETVGWQDYLDQALGYLAERQTAHQGGAIALNVREAIAVVADAYRQAQEDYAEIVELPVEVTPLETQAFQHWVDVTQWQRDQDGRFVAQVVVDFPSFNLVNATLALRLGDDVVEGEKIRPEGRYSLVGGMYQGRYYVAVLLEPAPGYDPSHSGEVPQVGLRMLRRKRHGMPVLAVFKDMGAKPPPIAFLPMQVPGRYFARIPRRYVSNTLGCMLIEDEAAYYAAKMLPAAIERGADGAPVINVHLAL